jgi:hypothetical protein
MAITTKAAAPGQSGAMQERPHFGFWRHLLEMIAAMMVGMLAGAAVFLTAVGMTADQAIRRYPVLFVTVMAISMTVPMVAWMRYRGHGWRNSAEMAAAMVVPAIVFICLRWAHVISGPICGLYCASTIPAMIGAMLYRRDEYGMTKRRPATITAAPENR